MDMRLQIPIHSVEIDSPKIQHGNFTVIITDIVSKVPQMYQGIPTKDNSKQETDNSY